MVPAGREALAWSDADHRHDAYRHSGKARGEGCRLDGTRHRRSIPAMTLVFVAMAAGTLFCQEMSMTIRA